MIHAFPHAISELQVDLRHPSAARVYDFLLGGSSHWAVDRAFARRLLGNFPEISDMALANRIYWGEAGWILEDNPAMIAGMVKLGWKHYKTYRLYDRSL